MQAIVSKILRLVLVFSLAFMVTWQFEYGLAYGDEANDDTTTQPADATASANDSNDSSTPEAPANNGDEENTSGNDNTESGAETNPAPDVGGNESNNQENTGGNDNNNGNEGGSENGNNNQGGDGKNSDSGKSSDKPSSESHAFIKTIEILKEDTNKDKNKSFGSKETLKVEAEKTGTYKFRARVVYVPDSNKESETKEVIVTSTSNLSKLTGGLLADLEWEIYIPSKDANGKDIEKKDIPASQAKINKTTGELTIALGTAVTVRAYSSKGGRNNGYVSSTVPTEAVEPSSESSQPQDADEPKTIVPVHISYDANGGEGEMLPTTSNAEGIATLAENAFEAPEGKHFGGWNTLASGEGARLSPGDAIDATRAAQLLAEQEGEGQGSEQVLDNAAGEGTEDGAEDGAGESGVPSGSEDGADGTSGEQENSSSEEASNSEPSEPINITLYARWLNESEDGLSGNGTPRVSISYIPSPLQGNAFLAPVLSDVGHITFYYEWEVSTNGGATWEYAPNENVQFMLVPTTPETIGWQYRVSVHADKIFDEATGSQVITSEPITIREAGADEFLAMLEYDPAYEGSEAVFGATLYNQGNGAVRYEWLESSDYGRTWTTIGNNAPNLSVPTDEQHMGNWYRVKAYRSGAGSENTCDDGIDGDECSCDPDVACSNVQMLVALSDTDPADLEPSNNTDNTGVDEGADETGEADDNSQSTPSSSPDSGNPNSGPASQNTDTWDNSETGTPANTEPAETLPAAGESTPMPSPTPTPSQPTNLVPVDSIAESSEAPSDDIAGLNLLKDPEVSQRIAESREDESANSDAQPGARWRKLSVIPQQEEIQQVLESNPFAPFVAPLTVGLLACGMAERLVYFRREKRESGAAFA